MPSFGATQGEYEFYNWTNIVLEKIANVEIEYGDTPISYSGITYAFGPKILLDPTFAITLKEIRDKFKGTNKISKNSTLILKGNKTTVNNLDLDGYLVVNEGTVVEGKIDNKERIEFVLTTDKDPEIYRIRGFKPAYVKQNSE